MRLDNYECDGQLSIFDVVPEADVPNRAGKPDFKGIQDEILRYSIAEKFEQSITLTKCCGIRPQDMFKGCYERFVQCPKCNKRTDYFRHGYEARQAWNRGETHYRSEITDDYIRKNPTCFYVFGHYLDREQGWHKVPDQLPTFTEWTLIDVVVFGKKTNTAWMEHGKWEAKDWTFRSVDQRRDTETTEILAWKIGGEQQ